MASMHKDALVFLVSPNPRSDGMCILRIVDLWTTFTADVMTFSPNRRKAYCPHNHVATKPTNRYKTHDTGDSVSIYMIRLFVAVKKGTESN